MIICFLTCSTSVMRGPLAKAGGMKAVFQLSSVLTTGLSGVPADEP